MTVTQNYIYEAAENRLNSENAPISNLKIKVCKTNCTCFIWI